MLFLRKIKNRIHQQSNYKSSFERVYRFRILFIFCLFSQFGLAQSDSVLLTKNFKFEDGVFLNYEDFQNNDPTYRWNELEVGIFSNPKTYLTQVYFMKLKKGQSSQIIDLDKVWGISLDGIPYVQMDKKELKKENAVFSALKVRGKICYLEYEVEVKRMIPMPVYNPLTGKPFRTMNVERNVPIEFKKMMHFDSGQIEDFTVSNFKHWIKEDEKLLQSISEMNELEAAEKLFKCLLIYVDRNEKMIPNNKQ